MKKNNDLLGYLQSYHNISCGKYSSPLGEIYLFGDDTSLKAVVFGSNLPSKNRYVSFLRRGNGIQVDLAEKYLDSYFQKNSQRKPVKISFLKSKNEKSASASEGLLLNISRFTETEQKVYQSLMKVGKGKTISYGELAVKSGNPGAARFIGTTMAKNLFPIIIPCHRVVKSNGTRGFYTGGVKIKDFLLDHELN